MNNILVESCEFNSCDIGISGIGLGIQAYHNTMSRISDMGIRSINLLIPDFTLVLIILPK